MAIVTRYMGKGRGIIFRKMMLDVAKLASQTRRKPRQTFCVRTKRSNKTGDSQVVSGMTQKKPSSVPMASQR